MNTNFDFGRLKDKTGWKRALAFFLSVALLLTGIMIPNSPLPGAMTTHASASGDPRGQYYMEDSFPISYLEQEEIHTITAMGNLDPITSVTWYQFTPAETAQYMFQGNDMMGEPDTYGSIYTKNTETGEYERFAYNDDGDDGIQFGMAVNLKAGTTYYLCAAYLSSDNGAEYMPSFNRTYITDSTRKINGIAKSSVTTTLGRSYILEADVSCVNGVTPTYEWYTYDDEGIKKPLAGTNNKYTYTETGGSAKYIQVYCDVKAETDVKTLRFYLSYDPLRITDFLVDGIDTRYSSYQMNHTYNLQVEAVSSTGSRLTYTWKLNGTVLQTGKNNSLSFTPTKAILGEDYDYIYIYCEVSDENGNSTSSYIGFEYRPITDVKKEINGSETMGKCTVVAGVPYTLRVSATAEKGKTLTYQWTNADDAVLGSGQTYQYTPSADKTTEGVCCTISDGTKTYICIFSFQIRNISKPSLTVNGSSASGNAIPVHVGESYQLKASAQTSPGKTLTYQWGTMVDGEFTALTGKTGDTYTCSITKADDILYNLVCRISDSDGNTVNQKCYMKYRPIYNVERSINNMPIHRIETRVGQAYTLAVKAQGEPGKTLTYAWFEDGNKVSSTNTYLYTAKSESKWISCEISDGTNKYSAEFQMSYFDTAVYDFTIKGVSTNVAYAYVGEKVTLELKDKFNMLSDDIYWSWYSEDSYNSKSYKKQITITMGKDIIEGSCEWDDGYSDFTLIPCTSHTYTSNGSKPATTAADGAIANTCTKCGYGSTAAIAKVSNIKLSKTSLDYTGKNQNVTLTVQDRTGKQLKAGVDYDYTFNGKKNAAISVKNVGQYTVKVVFKGNYSGTSDLTFTVNPPSPTLSKVTATKKGFKAKWKKSKAKVTGYEICYSTNKSFKKKGTKTIPVNGYKTTSKTVKKLKAKTKYFVKIRTYQNVKVGKKTVKLYSKWSSVKNVKTRK